MFLRLKIALFLFETYCILTLSLAATSQTKSNEVLNIPLIQDLPIASSQIRSARIAEFISTPKILDEVQRKHGAFSTYVNDDDDNKQLWPNSADTERSNTYIRVSVDNPTTILPILTTQRAARSFDFVPVNIVREDMKGSPFSHFNEDISDISLIPAGSNTRIQVKKGPNGKDYEYEYVYYYYDEDDGGKEMQVTGETGSNLDEVPTKTSGAGSSLTSSQRRGSINRNKNSNFDRTTMTTVFEPVINEVITSSLVGGIRAKQFETNHEDITEERLPPITRFPPRIQTDQPIDAGSTEHTNRVRGGKPRSALDGVDTKIFHAHQEGPEFPSTLPNGPVRFLGVTPNESNDDKRSLKSRGRPQRLQQTTDTLENYEEILHKRHRPNVVEAAMPASLPQLKQQQQQQQQHSLDHLLNRERVFANKEDERDEIFTNQPEERETLKEEVTESPMPTQLPYAMNKIALDLYAFLQQGRSNLVDFMKEHEEFEESEEVQEGSTTEFAVEGTTFQPGELFEENRTTTRSSVSTTTTTVSMIHTTIDEALPIMMTSDTAITTSITPTSSVSIGRGKLRRPLSIISTTVRSRFKPQGNLGINASTSTTNTVPIDSTQKSRVRFGGSFKRSRIMAQKLPVQKLEADENSRAITLENKQGRGRYRSATTRSGNQTSNKLSTPAPSTQLPAPHAPILAHRSAVISKLGPLSRRRSNRPLTTMMQEDISGGTVDQSVSSTFSPNQEIDTSEQQLQQHRHAINKLPGVLARPKIINKPIVKLGAGRLSLRPRPGQLFTTITTEIPVKDISEVTPEELASEGTEEETKEIPLDTSPATRATTVNPLNKLRNRSRIHIQPKSTTARILLSPAARRSPLLPRRKVSDNDSSVLAAMEIVSNTSTAVLVSPSGVSNEAEDSDDQPIEADTTVPKHHEEVGRNRSSLLVPRRRIPPRKSGSSIITIGLTE